MKDPACPVHGEDAAPAWAKVVAFLVAVPVIIVLLALVMILGFGAVAHAIHWAGHQ